MEGSGEAGSLRLPSTDMTLTTAELKSTRIRRGSGRKKVNQACVYCQRSHMTCDKERPCQRCVKRRIGHLCHDPPASFISTVLPFTQTMTTRSTGRGRASRSAPNDKDTTRTGGPEKEGELENGERTSPPSPLKIKEAAQILFNLHDQIDLIIRNYNPRPDVPEGRPFDEKQSYQSLIQFFDEHYSLDGKTRVSLVINKLKAGLVKTRETYGQTPWDEIHRLITYYSLEFDKVLAATATPHLLIRLSGEILRANQSLASIVRIPTVELTSHWRFYELLTEESYVNFVEKTTNLLLLGEERIGSLLTICALVPGGLRSLAVESSTAMSPLEATSVKDSISPLASGSSSRSSLGPSTPVRCALSIGIRRDRHHIPLLMVLSIIPLVN